MGYPEPMTAEVTAESMKSKMIKVTMYGQESIQQHSDKKYKESPDEI
jgi:hypothetical protein